MSVVSVLRTGVAELGSRSVYELSCRGALHRFLSRNAGRLHCSEYFADCPPGAHRDGIQCQDVQRLTLADRSFDLCTCTEVFEHVPDDALGFAEIRRVLKPGGHFLFTVPLIGSDETLERATMGPDGTVEHLQPPVYHGDPAKGHGAVLAFRDYGSDIVGRLTAQGFESVQILKPPDPIPWGYARSVIVARRGR
jgi:SAM-dependent methyltransferase